MFDGRDPIYLQIADQIRRDVLSGAIREDEQVMSTTQYATTYRINPATAAKAFAILVDEGVLVKQRGVGMFVRSGAAEQLRRAHRAAYFKTVLEPALDQATTLGITADEIVQHIRSAEEAPEGARS